MRVGREEKRCPEYIELYNPHYTGKSLIETKSLPISCTHIIIIADIVY